MSTQELQLGKIVNHKEREYLVVRLIEGSYGLFEDETGNQFIVEESYAQLKAENGDVEFVTISHEKRPYTPEPGMKIRPMESMSWLK